MNLQLVRIVVHPSGWITGECLLDDQKNLCRRYWPADGSAPLRRIVPRGQQGFLARFFADRERAALRHEAMREKLRG